MNVINSAISLEGRRKQKLACRFLEMPSGFDVDVPDFRTRYLDSSRREGKQTQNRPRTWKRGKDSQTVAALGRNLRAVRLAGINRASADPCLLQVEPLDEAVARRSSVSP